MIDSYKSLRFQVRLEQCVFLFICRYFSKTIYICNIELFLTSKNQKASKSETFLVSSFQSLSSFEGCHVSIITQHNSKNTPQAFSYCWICLWDEIDCCITPCFVFLMNSRCFAVDEQLLLHLFLIDLYLLHPRYCCSASFHPVLCHCYIIFVVISFWGLSQFSNHAFGVFLVSQKATGFVAFLLLVSMPTWVVYVMLGQLCVVGCNAIVVYVELLKWWPFWLL